MLVCLAYVGDVIGGILHISEDADARVLRMSKDVTSKSCRCQGHDSLTYVRGLCGGILHISEDAVGVLHMSQDDVLLQVLPS